ncbi:MAG: hypothetical protein WC979_08860 [Candidatus Pacearchaeota archaeon]
MKTQIRHSYIYNVVMSKKLGLDYSLKKFNNLKKKAKAFEKLHNKYVKEIIKLIEKHTKRKKWNGDFIPIYLTETIIDNYSGFSDPLTLKIREPKKMLHTLVHELIHNNLDASKQIKLGTDKNEELVSEITKKVWKELKV